MSSVRRMKALACSAAWLVTIVAIVLVSNHTAMAQAITGSLRGTVTDTNGGVVAGASVKAKNEATGVETAVTASSEGAYDIPGLPPGTYTVTVEAAGFKLGNTMGAVVKIGIVNALDVKLEAGNITETVTVTANTEEVVQRDQSQVSTTIETRRIQELPSNGAGGGLDTLALLAPGVIPNRSGGTNTNGTGLSVNGNRGRSNNFQIDGSDNNDLSVAGPAMFVDNQDAVQEYQVITNNFSAQYGRNQGAVVNIVTKGGGNQYHGSAFEFHQDNKNLNSLNNIEKRGGQTEPNASLYNVFGGTVGGPIYLPRFGQGGKSVIDGKDRFFFFFSYQGVRNPSTTTRLSTQLGILSSEFARLSAAFPGNAVVNSITRYSAFAIPGARARTDVGTATSSMVSLTANSGCPAVIAVGSTPPAGCVGYTNGPFLTGGAYDVVNLNGQLFQAAQYARDFSTPFAETDYSLRFDVKATAKDNVTVRYLKQSQNNVNLLTSSANGFQGDVVASSKNFGGTWTRQVSNRMVNEFRATYQRIGVVFGGGCDVATLGCIPDPTQIGSTITNITFFAGLGITKPGAALTTIGPATNLPQGRIGKVYQFADNLSYSLGRHSLTFGAEYKHLSNLSPFLANFNGTIAYTSTGRMINNAPSGLTIAVGDPLLSYPENDQYYFVQDDFKIKPNLTLNLGLRYEYTGQPINVLNQASMARESNPATAFFNPALPVSARTVPPIPADKNNFAPRVGFAYTPHFWKGILGEDATVIRGGFSIAYDAAYYNILTNVQGGAPFSIALTLGSNLLPATNSPFPLPGGSLSGDVIRAAASSSGILPLGKLNPIFLTQTKVAPNFHSPYAEQYSLGVQHQFGRNQVAEVRYVGTHGVGLFQNINGNFFVAPLLNGFSRSGFNFKAFPQFVPAGITAQVCTDNPVTFDNEAACNGRILPQGSVTTRANSSQSVYQSMQSRYNGRFLKNSLTLGAAYTWSKTIDDSSEIFAETDILSPNAQNPFCPNRCERSLSALDRPHALSLNFIYDLPFMKEQRGFVGHLLGGWQLNGTHILTSGAAYTPGQSFNGTLGLGGTYLTAGDRPFVGNPNVDPRQVGINQVDAFLLFGVPVTNANGFYNLTAFNASGRTQVLSVTPNDVRFIFNGPGAAQVFNTPFGTAARNSLRGPALNQMNLSLFKNIKVGERLRVQLRAEAFNVLNHPNPGVGVPVVSTAGGYLPVNDVGAAGRTGSAFAENQDLNLARRVVQFGLRIGF